MNELKKGIKNLLCLYVHQDAAYNYMLELESCISLIQVHNFIYNCKYCYNLDTLVTIAMYDAFYKAVDELPYIQNWYYDLGKDTITGQVYGRNNISDGSEITTGTKVDLAELPEFYLFETKNTVYKLLK